MTRRPLALAAATVAWVLLAWPAAGAKYRGTDVLGNIAPASMLDGGSLADRHPLSAYSLDYHTDVGITDLDGVPATIAHWASAQLWSLTSFLSKTVIDLLTWAFSLDLLGGTGSGQGALAPVADAITSLYENVIGEAWMVAAVVLAGIWGIWKALVQRRYTETAGALAVSVLFVVLALFRLSARAHDRPGQRVDQHALARVPLRRQPRHDRRPRKGQAPGRRPAL